MSRKHYFLLSFLMFAFLWVGAQENAAQNIATKSYKQGEELFQKKKYNLAYRYFEKFISNMSVQEQAKMTSDLANAYYYRAVSAKYSNSPKAEEWLLDYIREYSGTEMIYAAYYHVGDYYFLNKNYKDAIVYFQKSDKQALTADEAQELTFKYAFSQFSLRKFKEAKATFSPIVNRPDSKYYYDAVYYSGLSAYYIQDYKSALDLFQKLNASTKYKNIIPYYIASIQFENKQYDEMIQYVENALQTNKSIRYVYELKKLLGNAYFEQKNYPKAEQYLSESLGKLAKANQEDFYQLGYVLYKNGQYDKAIAQLSKLTALKNEMAQNALFVLGQSYLQVGKKDNAKPAFQQASRMTDNPAIMEESLFTIAKITYEQKNYTEALALLKSFINKYPNSKFNTEAQEILSDVLLKNKAYDESLTLIESMKNKSDQIKLAYQKMAFYRAMDFYSNKNLFQANEYLEKALTYKMDKGLEALTYYWKADVAHQQGKFDESNRWLTQFNAISSAVSTANSKISSGVGDYLQAYNSYKKKDFTSSQILFAKAVSQLQNNKDIVIQQTIYPDAILRLADSYYMQKRYAEALTQYQKVTQMNAKGADYGWYQMGMLSGLQGNVNSKIEYLNKVGQSYKGSPYADDALFELGNTYSSLDRGREAINTYTDLIRSYPKSEFVPYAYNRTALIQYNMNDSKAALASYKYVIQNYPRTKASEEALIAVKDIYIENGNPDEYFQLLKQYPGAQISTSAQDSIVYQVAENQYLKGNYTLAIQGFDAYINGYPNGAFILPATFYRAESKYFSGNLVGSLPDYEKVIKYPTNTYTERALDRASLLKMNVKEYKMASQYYQSLYAIANTEDTRNTAVLGAMRAFYFDKNYSKALEFAELASGNSGFSETEKVEATFYKGMSNYFQNNKENARASLASVVQRTSNEWAAEAKYYLAKIAFNENSLDKAESLSFELISNYPSYTQWIVKTYILLSDVYVAKKDYFKARVTLETVLESYTQNDDLSNEVKQKLVKVQQLEQSDSKIIQPRQASGFSEFEN